MVWLGNYSVGMFVKCRVKPRSVVVINKLCARDSGTRGAGARYLNLLFDLYSSNILFIILLRLLHSFSRNSFLLVATVFFVSLGSDKKYLLNAIVKEAGKNLRLMYNQVRLIVHFVQFIVHRTKQEIIYTYIRVAYVLIIFNIHNTIEYGRFCQITYYVVDLNV